ncbi:hypothetical protein C8J57DRAFT_1183375 [Mycena rebaudengoi]|nr:hypothetical protein C8J57DRAFT_1183375 [Mycena rebaudengoi]
MTHDTAKSPLKGTQSPIPWSGAASNSAPPPVSSYQTMPQPTLYVQTYTEIPQYRRSPAMRFLMAFLVALGVWVVSSMLFGFIFHGRHWGHRWDIPSEVSLGRCVDDRDWILSTASTAAYNPRDGSTPSFDIPLTSETIILLSRRASSHWFSFTSHSNYLDITTSPTLHNVARVVVDRGEYPQFVKACMISRHNGEIGVGVFTARSLFGSWNASPLRLKLILPESKTTSAKLRRLVTDLPNFRHTVGNLTNTVKIDSVSFKTSNSPIYVEYLAALNINLRTSNSGISGSFNSSGTIELLSSNGPITVQVGLESVSNTPARLIMRTSNNRIESSISLSTPQGTRGKFDVSATTSNGRLNVDFPSSPPDSALDLTARTSNAAVSVTLHEAYEGSFALDTSNAKSSLRRLNPDEKGRVVSCAEHGRGLRGEVYWKKNNAHRGDVRVTTSNGPVVLAL